MKQPPNLTLFVYQGRTFDDVQLASTAAMVDNAQQLTVPVTGTYATKATLTVVNGVVTAIALT